MPATLITYQGNGTQTDYNIPFDYLKKSFVTVSLQSTTLTGGDYGDTGADYYFLDKTTIRLKVAPPVGKYLTIRRYTSQTQRVVTFKDASVLKATDLDTSQLQAFHIASEARDIINDALVQDEFDNWDAKNHRIINVGNPVQNGDAVNYVTYKTDAQGARQSRLLAESARDAAKVSQVNSKASQTNAKASQTNAKASQTASKASQVASAASAKNSATSASQASASATSASTSATTATSQATLATTQATASKASADSAQLSKTAAKASQVQAKRQADIAKDYAGQATQGQIQADWNETSTTSKAYIKNKPTIVKSVNNVSPDVNGIVNIDVGVKKINSAVPDVNGNVTLNYLPTSGGTVTGDITLYNGQLTSPLLKFYSGALLGTYAQNGLRQVALFAGENGDIRKGAGVVFRSTSSISPKGTFSMFTRKANGDLGATLEGSPDGYLEWGGKHVVRSVNNALADANGNVVVDSFIPKQGQRGYIGGYQRMSPSGDGAVITYNTVDTLYLDVAGKTTLNITFSGDGVALTQACAIKHLFVYNAGSITSININVVSGMTHIDWYGGKAPALSNAFAFSIVCFMHDVSASLAYNKI